MASVSKAYETLLYEPDGNVLVITLNRPEKLNAWNGKMESEFLDALDAASSDAAIRAIVVTGAGRAFCAGGDISAWSEDLTSGNSRRQASPLLARDGSPEVPIALARSKPVIAAINGHAVGIGLTVTLACDMRIASERAQFSARFVKVGLTPECGSTRYLPLVAGMGNALFMALTGRMIDATEAKERGIVDRVVPHDSLLEEAMALADEIAANPPSAVWLAKRLIHENANESNLRRVVTAEGFAIREARRQPDHAEAVQAFVEKRAPNFGG
ncbi:MAG: 2-(1,2-epoxy-1,2-dihydrophenyl)acetyl-CoA isomerase [Chloroflexi bacterium]|jgi:2-(1,2-epoxy-1,2-dihydrophenyl)acetyl-CoA isomerase|nr:MAG: 2-(1,2-epoxy-1,2-dihydrophenyl)acetyl-CoA isomerase [Chloroflexota bacterium]